MNTPTPSSLEELLKTAETATSQPAEPPGGIPCQKTSPLLRKTLLCLFIPFLHLELLAEKIAKWIIRPPFKQIGTCKRRGNCCHYILFPETKGLIKKIFLFWNTEIHGFYQRTNLVYTHENQKVYVMGCRHLKKDGSCGNYFFRPKVCRSWPIISTFGYPKILKGCGYQAKLRKGTEKKYPALHILEDDNLS